MDLSINLENFKCKTCIMSVEIFPDGSYGNIRVKDGNKAHAADIEMQTGHPFTPDIPYEYCFPKDMNFEDFCYRSAVLHQQMHTYVSLYQMGLWLEMYMLPLDSDEENKAYCLYSYEVTPTRNEESMSDLSPETSSAVLSTCIKLNGGNDFLKSLDAVMQDILNICGAIRCSVIYIDSENETVAVMGDASQPGFPSFLTTEEVRKEFYKLARTWEDTLAGSTCLIVKNEQDMLEIKKRNPEWYESLMAYQVKSMVLFPLRYNENVIGYIWATNFDVNSAVKIKEVLELSTFFIAAELSNYRLVRKLEVLSSVDILTGTLNRNAMNNRVAAFGIGGKETKSLGIIFADLNGLKRINDLMGHTAGDDLLRRAAVVLKQVFLTEEIYRAGGDEFVIIAENTSQRDFDSKVKKLREIATVNSEVSFAVGAYFTDSDIDIIKSMRMADELMYKDKEAYYEIYPDRRYR